MNSERRHELQQNTLAELLGGQLKKIEGYTKLIAAVVLVLVVALVGWVLYRSSAVAARSDATLELLQSSASGDPEALGAVGDKYGDTTAGALAKLYQADALLAEGINALFDDRDEAQAQLSEALKRYGEAAGMSKNMTIQSRANLGLARTHESMGQFDKAIAAYNNVVSIGESEAIVQAAQQRINRLNSPETQEFYAWFQKQDFRPADPAMPPAMPSGGSLPDFPDVGLPDIAPLDVPNELRGAASDGEAPGQITFPSGDAATESPAAPTSGDSPSPPDSAAPPDSPPPPSSPGDAAAETADEPASETSEPPSEPAQEPAVIEVEVPR